MALTSRTKKRELNLNTHKLNLNWRRTKSKVMEIIKQTQMNKMKSYTWNVQRKYVKYVIWLI